MMGHGGVIEAIGSENIFSSSDQPIVELEQCGCHYCTEALASLARKQAIRA